MSKRDKFYICGRMVITREKKVLMGKEFDPDDPDWCMWETPGGGLKPGETLEGCLSREADEEIGAKIRIKNELPRFRSFSGGDAEGMESRDHWLMVYCRCELLDEPDLSRASEPEFTELRFVSQRDFDDIVREGRMARDERRFLPGVMVDLGLWAQ